MMRSIKKHITFIKYLDASEMRAIRMLNFASHQENEMFVTKYILESNHSVKRPKGSFGGIQLGSLSFVLMVMKELRHLMPDKEAYVRNYGDGVLYKPGRIWWLGRNKFIRFMASAASLD